MERRRTKGSSRTRAAMLAVWLSVLGMLGTLGTLLTGCSQKIETVTVQIGARLPDAVQSISNATNYIEGVVDGRTTRAGVYDIPAQDEDGKAYTLRLKVVDRTAPVVIPKHAYCAQGTTPEAIRLIGSIEEIDTYTAEFTDPLPDMSELGDYEVSFRVTDASGNRTKVLHTVVTVIQDTEPPVFQTVPELNAYVGEAIAYRDGLVVEDNCCGEITIEVDASAVTPGVVGDFSVIYTATDAAGNSASAHTTLHVGTGTVSTTELDRRIDSILSDIVTAGMSTEDKLRAVYDYIQGHIVYAASTDTGDRVRIAAQSLSTGTADCYAYNCVAIAFLERLGVAYREVQRSSGLTADTHYWLMVNIGTTASPRWYHYDCTRLRAEYNHSGCLLTDIQIRAYSKVRANFYTYDTGLFPTCATEIITPTPELEPYY